MEEYDKRVTAMYNDCWKLYRDYTKSHDMRAKCSWICLG